MKTDLLSVNNNENLIDDQNNKQNINEIQRCPIGHEEYYNVYKKCFELLPESRPNISQILKDIFLN